VKTVSVPVKVLGNGNSVKERLSTAIQQKGDMTVMEVRKEVTGQIKKHATNQRDADRAMNKKKLTDAEKAAKKARDNRKKFNGVFKKQTVKSAATTAFNPEVFRKQHEDAQAFTVNGQAFIISCLLATGLKLQRVQCPVNARPIMRGMTVTMFNHTFIVEKILIDGGLKLFFTGMTKTLELPDTKAKKTVLKPEKVKKPRAPRKKKEEAIG
jgi:hypothetical protein